MRITINHVPGWLSHGMTEEEILDEHPDLEEDFAAVYAFAAAMADIAYGRCQPLEVSQTRIEDRRER